MPADSFHGVERKGQKFEMDRRCCGCLTSLEGDLKTAGLVQVESQSHHAFFFVAELMDRPERASRSRFHLDWQDFSILRDHIVHFRVFGFSLAKPVVERWLARIEKCQMLPVELFRQGSLVHESLRCGLREAFPSPFAQKIHG